MKIMICDGCGSTIKDPVSEELSMSGVIKSKNDNGFWNITCRVRMDISSLREIGVDFCKPCVVQMLNDIYWGYAKECP